MAPIDQNARSCALSGPLCAFSTARMCAAVCSMCVLDRVHAPFIDQVARAYTHRYNNKIMDSLRCARLCGIHTAQGFRYTRRRSLLGWVIFCFVLDSACARASLCAPTRLCCVLVSSHACVCVRLVERTRVLRVCERALKYNVDHL